MHAIDKNRKDSSASEAGAGRRGFARASGMLSAVAAVGLVLGTPVAAHAAGNGTSQAEKLRRLDIMLMVTGLRCRKTADNFIDDYGSFTSRHMSELNEANRELRTELSSQYGKAGADKALDRMSVVMANEYGGGHPWLSCSELRQVTKSLALVQGHDTLVEAADQLLDRQPRPLLALAGR